MVQRKVPPIPQPHHHLNTDSHETKPNKGPALKKMMKKSGSIKRPKTTPNYMKPTTSSDARKEQSQVSPRNNSSSSGKKGAKTLLSRTLTKSPSFKPARASARKCSPSVLCESFDAQRATCSSTLKDSKFPAYLSLNHGGNESDGTSSVRVCPYTYCSLNGHHHPPLPPLKCFLSTRRSMIKNQRSIKMGCLVKPVVEDGDVIDEEKRDFFVEIYTKKDGDSNIIDEGFDADEAAIMEAISEQNEGVKADEEIEQNEEVKADEEIDQNEEVKADEEEVEDSDMEWEIGYDSSMNLDYDYDYDYDYEYSSGKDMEPDPDENEIINDEFVVESAIKDCSYNEFLVEEVAQESYAESLNSDAYSSSDDGDHLENNILLDSTHQSLTMEDSGVVLITANSKNPVEDGEDLGSFNPRGPNFLPLEPDKEAEKVDLKHQDLDERRNSEEWMVDYALRQVVTKLGPDRKRKVSLLVEAFEKVMPITKCDVHLRQHGSGFDQARPMQACS